jgi:hypothetical protein
LSFNEDNDNQSILFTPVRFINKDQYAVTSKAAGLPETQKMVTMTPYQADASGRAPKLEAPKTEAPAPEAEAEEAPKKRESKKAEVPAPTAKKSLASVAAAWSTDEE